MLRSNDGAARAMGLARDPYAQEQWWCCMLISNDGAACAVGLARDPYAQEQ